MLAWQQIRLITPSLVWQGPPFALLVWLNLISEAYKCMHRCLGLDEAATVAHSGRGKGRVFAAAVRTWLHNDHWFEMGKKEDQVPVILRRIGETNPCKDFSIHYDQCKQFVSPPGSLTAFLRWVNANSSMSVFERKSTCLRLNFIYPIPSCHLLPDCI